MVNSMYLALFMHKPFCVVFILFLNTNLRKPDYLNAAFPIQMYWCIITILAKQAKKAGICSSNLSGIAASCVMLHIYSNILKILRMSEEGNGKIQSHPNKTGIARLLSEAKVAVCHFLH